MPAESRSERARLGVADAWRLLNAEQRVAAVGAVLLIVSTFGPFSFVEAAIVLLGGAILYLLYKRAEGREFHVPFGDGAVIAAAGIWAGLLILIRLFDRPPGQGLLALVCAAILVLAGLRERAKRPLDDIPAESRGRDWLAEAGGGERDWSAGERPARYQPRARERPGEEATERLWRDRGADPTGVGPADPPEWSPAPDEPAEPEEPDERARRDSATEPLFDDDRTDPPTGAPEPDVPPPRPAERPD
jgi:hypothetical protein